MNSQIISRAALYSFGSAIVAIIIYIIIALLTGGKLTNNSTISPALVTGAITFVIAFILFIFFNWLGRRNKA